MHNTEASAPEGLLKHTDLFTAVVSSIFNPDFPRLHKQEVCSTVFSQSCTNSSSGFRPTKSRPFRLHRGLSGFSKAENQMRNKAFLAKLSSKELSSIISNDTQSFIHKWHDIQLTCSLASWVILATILLYGSTIFVLILEGHQCLIRQTKLYCSKNCTWNNLEPHTSFWNRQQTGWGLLH